MGIIFLQRTSKKCDTISHLRITKSYYSHTYDNCVVHLIKTFTVKKKEKTIQSSKTTFYHLAEIL